MLASFAYLLTLLSALGVVAMPGITPPVAPERRAQVTRVTPMPQSQISALAPYTQFARAAYCSPSVIQGWRCGEACEAVPSFKVSLTGGNGNSMQYYYVGYWPSNNSVVVARQGTDPTQLLSVLTDTNIKKDNLDPTLFPGIDNSVKVHSGFADEHADSARIILTEVRSLISQHGATSVTLVGHSLGGALAELDCMFMALNLPSGIAIKGVTYGTPRITDFQRINNKRDIVPIVPGRFLGFSHVKGEVHILGRHNAVECPGDDDASDPQCTIMSVPNILVGNVFDHFGPYQGIYLGTTFCT
ncbi:Alpha/Beta hydrolase protein [Melanogaster broomeanus]|nr:Alpha/Beta hydrolase protein [Melanogaster broomeanus]